MDVHRRVQFELGIVLIQVGKSELKRVVVNRDSRIERTKRFTWVIGSTAVAMVLGSFNEEATSH